MIILGIETSCDETAISLIETCEKDGELQVKVLNNSVLSQIELHKKYGGVFPIMAKREHAKNLAPLLVTVLKETGFIENTRTSETLISPQQKEAVEAILSEKEKELFAEMLTHPCLWVSPDKNGQKVDLIAVTQGPGLEPALWVGINFAKALNVLWGTPIVPVNHMEGHIVGSLLPPHVLNSGDADFTPLKELRFPSLSLLISGGHTELVVAKDYHQYEIIGRTRDDAIGEAYDKVARILGLPYPGGPQISKLAEIERSKFPERRTTYSLPRPMIQSKDLDFSFSGIKTAVLYLTQQIKKSTGDTLPDDIKQQIAREFEDAVTEVLISKTKKGAELHGVQTILVGGGVIANLNIRKELEKMTNELGVPLLLPESNISTDNALMIAIAGALTHRNSKSVFKSDFKAHGNMSLGDSSNH